MDDWKDNFLLHSDESQMLQGTFWCLPLANTVEKSMVLSSPAYVKPICKALVVSCPLHESMKSMISMPQYLDMGCSQDDANKSAKVMARYSALSGLSNYLAICCPLAFIITVK